MIIPYLLQLLAGTIILISKLLDFYRALRDRRSQDADSRPQCSPSTPNDENEGSSSTDEGSAS
jgi:hypothetical protein